MIYNSDLFKNKKFDNNKLKAFGFNVSNGVYLYKTTIMNGSFELQIQILKTGNIDIRVIETATDTDYDLVFVKNIQGKFVGEVKSELENVLFNIAENCTVNNIFKSEYSHKVIDFINRTYGDNPEYLWEKSPNNAIFRRNDKKGKWYAAILTVSAEKIGIKGTGEVEVIDLKANPNFIENNIDNKKYFPAYHMNKKHWYTICLDGSVTVEEIYKRINESYNSLK